MIASSTDRGRNYLLHVNSNNKTSRVASAGAQPHQICIRYLWPFPRIRIELRSTFKPQGVFVLKPHWWIQLSKYEFESHLKIWVPWNRVQAISEPLRNADVLGPVPKYLKEGKWMLVAYAVKCVAAGVYLPIPWLIEPAKCPHDRADYCLDCSLLP